MIPDHNEPTRREAPAHVQQIDVPEQLSATATLPHIDYEDAFRVEDGHARERTAQAWAKAVLEDAPPHLRRAVLAGWRSIGFQLGPVPAEGFVLGWKLRHRSPDRAILTAGSPLGIAGELVFAPGRDELLYATFVQLDGARAREMWARIEPEHPRIVRELLGRAAGR